MNYIENCFRYYLMYIDSSLHKIRFFSDRRGRWNIYRWFFRDPSRLPDGDIGLFVGLDFGRSIESVFLHLQTHSEHSIHDYY